MGLRGPRPKPSAVKALEGNPGHRPIDSENEPQPAKPATSPKAPKHVTGEARRLWNEVVPELYELGLVTLVDLAAVEGMCIAYGKALRADADVQRNGLTVKTPTGRRVNPAAKLSKEFWQQYRQFAQEFGMTASARTRVRADETPPPKPGTTTQPKDQAKDFLFERKLRRA